MARSEPCLRVVADGGGLFHSEETPEVRSKAKKNKVVTVVSFRGELIQWRGGRVMLNHQ